MSLRCIPQNLISFVFQSQCCFCRGPVDREDMQDGSERGRHARALSCLSCRSCLGELFDQRVAPCMFCGAVTGANNPFHPRCRCCHTWSSHIQLAVSLGNYGGKLRDALLKIKRGQDDVWAKQMGLVLGQVCLQTQIANNVDVVTAVPSAWRRRFGRNGFHCAEILSEGVARQMRLPMSRRLLKCARITKKQSKLSPKQRIKNVRGAFRLPRRVAAQDLRVLLVDDVMTSGATIAECARVLVEGGVRSIYVAVAARGIGIS